MKAVLNDRAIIAVSSLEAKTFLQGLITNDINKVAPDLPLYAALLTPQGKILFDFLICERDGAILLDCARATAEALQKRLTLYRLRAKVDIARRDDLAVVASWNGDALGGGCDPRVADLGWRAVVADGDVAENSSESYTAHRLALGVPEARDFGQDEMFALDADLEELHGVSFEKGCYVGQELTARMKHRGTARKKLLPVETVSGGALPPPGSRFSAAGSDLGAVTSIYGGRGFALLRMDRLAEAEAEGKTLEAAGVPVRVNRPMWLFA
jgi:folate-binding protein YgfZ